MAISKRAQDALNVLEQEGVSSSALASIRRDLGGHGPDEEDRDTPGRQQSREITREGFARQEARPYKASGDRPPPAPPQRGSNNDSSATDANSREAKLDFLRRRGGTARKG
jgi:hypothetical protein